MKPWKKQCGATVFSWFLILCMVGVIGLAAMKLLPAYLEYYNIASVLDVMQQEPTRNGGTKNEIAATFFKRLSINGVSSVNSENFKITKIQGKKAYLLEVDYEVREPLFGNIFIVASFKRSIELGEGAAAE